MCMSHNTAGLHLEHLDWENDCLVIKFAKHKSDQVGASSDVKKHVYAKPENPVICPILRMAVLSFCTKR